MCCIAARGVRAANVPGSHATKLSVPRCVIRLSVSSEEPDILTEKRAGYPQHPGLFSPL